MPLLEDITKAGRGVGQGLLDVLGAITSPAMPILEQIPQIAAQYQAYQGNPAALQMMQQQKASQDLMQQLAQMQTQPTSEKPQIAAPQIQMTPRLQSAIKSGNTEAFNKEVERQQGKGSLEVQIRSNKLLDENEKSMLIGQLGSNIPTTEVAKQMTSLITSKSRQQTALSRKQEERQYQQKQADIKEQKKLEIEQRKKAEAEAKLPGNILAAGLESGEISTDNPAAMIGYLLDKGAKLPQKPGEQRKFLNDLLNAPRMQQYIKQQPPGFLESLSNAIFGSKSTATTAPATTTMPTQQGWSIKKK